MAKTLPLDCVLQVVEAVEDLDTINILLCVNRIVFRAAARNLYHDPFFYLCQARDRQMAFEAFVHLVLALSPANDKWTQVFRNIRGVQRADGRDSLLPLRPQPMMDYLGLIRRFDWGTMLEECGDYIVGKDSVFSLRAALEFKWLSASAALQHLLAWAVCGHQPEMIQSLYICASEAVHYLGVIDRWTSLRSLTLDATTYVSFDYEERTLKHLTQGLEFLQALAAYHGKEYLESLTILTTKDPAMLVSESSKALWMEIIQYQKPLRRPRAIGPHNWDRFSVGAGRIDCTWVQSVCISPSMIKRSLEQWWPNFSFPRLLEQCHRLRQLETTVEGSDFFQWALMGREEQVYSLLLDGRVQVGTARYPLRQVRLFIPTAVWKEVVADMFQAFGGTLEYVKLEGILGNPEHSLCVGPLNCPRLRHLSISTSFSLGLARDALAGCTQLESLELADILSESEDVSQESQDATVVMQEDRWQIYQWPNLTDLRLKGQLAKSFHPATLYGCCGLRTLTLRSGLIKRTTSASPWRRDYMACQQQQQQQHWATYQLWTWDWALPVLTELVLVGTFASWFDMKALALYPRLETLHLELLQSQEAFLDLPTAWFGTPYNRKKLPRQALSSTAHYHGNQSGHGGGESAGGSGSTGGHVAQTVKKVLLHGSWRLSNSVLEGLLLHVLPNLEHLELNGCLGYDTSCLMRCLERHGSIKTMVSSCRLSKESAKKAGLIALDRRTEIQRPPVLTFHGEKFVFKKRMPITKSH